MRRREKSVLTQDPCVKFLNLRLMVYELRPKISAMLVFLRCSAPVRPMVASLRI